MTGKPVAISLGFPGSVGTLQNARLHFQKPSAMSWHQGHHIFPTQHYHAKGFHIVESS